MARLRIGYFLEDAGQERFLTALVIKIAESGDLSEDQLHHDVRNATGGEGRVAAELRRFLHDVASEGTPAFDVLLVAVDAN